MVFRGRALDVPFRVKLAGLIAFAVLVTLGTFLVPVYRQQRADLVQLEGQRLSAMARTAAAALSADALDAIAASAAQNSPAFTAARNTLAKAWLSNGGLAAETHGGLSVARRDGDRYRTLAHSQWSADDPQYRTEWALEPELADSLAAGRPAISGLVPGDSGKDVVRAVAPVGSSAGPSSDAVVAELRADRFLGTLTGKFLWMLPYSLIAFLIGVGLSYYPARTLTNGMEQVGRHAKLVSQGSLRAQLDFTSTDEFGALADAVRTMTASLRSLLRDVDAGAAEVAATAEELAADASQMNGTTEQVASAASEIAEATGAQTQVIAGMLDGAKRAADRARTTTGHSRAALQTAEHVAETALNGTAAADAALQRMAVISNVTAAAVPVVTELVEKSKRIAKITDTIGGIARQTNLLALNAAIEAARAGDQGLGFAVVADEVRKLAGETQQALESIQALVVEIQSAATRAGGQVAQVRERVGDGEAVIRASADALHQISQQIALSRDAVALIAEATELQLSDAEALAVHVESVAQSAEENAATSQEVSAAAQEQSASMQHVSESSQHLADVASRLRSLLARFEL